MKKRIAVLFGGVSVEHEVSVISGTQAFHALDGEKYEKFPVYITKQGRWYVGSALQDVSRYSQMSRLLDACQEVAPRPVRGDWNLYPINDRGSTGIRTLFQRPTPISVDVYLPVFHGSFGEDGSIQGLFQMMDVPFAGCDVNSSSTTMDKVTMKEVLKGLGLPVVSSCWFTRHELEDDLPALLRRVGEQCGFPCILKPALLGSSIGIEVVKSEGEFSECARRVASYCSKILVEVFLADMMELNCSVLGNENFQQASVLERPLSSGELLSFADKYQRRGGKTGGKSAGGGKTSGDGGGMAAMDRVIPADVSDERTLEVQKLAKEVFRGLGCSGVSRIDFMVDRSTDKLFVNELNSIPGSLSFYLWEKSGIPFSALLDRLIELGLERYREKQLLNYTFDANLFALHSKGGHSKGGGSKR